MKNKKRVIVAGFICIIASFAGLISSTLAWFSMYNSATVNGMVVKAKTEDIVATPYLYKCDPNNFEGTGIDPDTNNPWDVSDFSFLTYDTIFRARNTYTPVLMRIALTGKDLVKEGSIRLTLTHDSSKDGDGEKLSLFFSSIIRFTFFIDGYVYNPNENGKIMYDNAHRLFTSSSNPDRANYDSKIFPTKDQDDLWSKEESLVFEYDYDEEDWNKISKVDTLNLYLYMDYDSDLITDFIGEQEFSSETLKNNTSDFENDLISIYVEQIL